MSDGDLVDGGEVAGEADLWLRSVTFDERLNRWIGGELGPMLTYVIGQDADPAVYVLGPVARLLREAAARVERITLADLTADDAERP
jgi:hypothetical protein